MISTRTVIDYAESSISDEGRIPLKCMRFFTALRFIQNDSVEIRSFAPIIYRCTENNFHLPASTSLSFQE